MKAESQEDSTQLTPESSITNNVDKVQNSNGTVQNNPEQVQELVPVDAVSSRKRKWRRIRALMLLLAVVLVCIAALFILLDVSPKPVAPEADVTPIREIYGFGAQASQLISPASVAFDPSGTNLWCADQGNFRLVDFDYKGTLRSVFEKDATGNTFDFPSDITVGPNGWIYVAQSTYNIVTIYDTEHKIIEQLEVPTPVSVAVNDNVLVIGCVAGFAIYQADGTYLSWVGKRGREEGQFDTINGTFIDEQDNIYIVDSFNRRLSKYTTAGQQQWTVDLGAKPANLQVPMGITIDGAGRLIIIDNLDFSISAFSAQDGTFIARYGDFGTAAGKFSYPADISYNNATDTFAVADTGNQRIQIVSIPNSGANLASATRRSLAGPLSACLIPAISLLVCGILYAIVRVGKRTLLKRNANQLRE